LKFVIALLGPPSCRALMDVRFKASRVIAAIRAERAAAEAAGSGRGGGSSVRLSVGEVAARVGVSRSCIRDLAAAMNLRLTAIGHSGDEGDSGEEGVKAAWRVDPAASNTGSSSGGTSSLDEEGGVTSPDMLSVRSSAETVLDTAIRQRAVQVGVCLCACAHLCCQQASSRSSQLCWGKSKPPALGIWALRFSSGVLSAPHGMRCSA
jgi:hypothetical protein